ncbi:MAG: hypothetical protein ABR498_10260 [Candidatus Dormibacteria bacterium]
MARRPSSQPSRRTTAERPVPRSASRRKRERRREQQRLQAASSGRWSRRWLIGGGAAVVVVAVVLAVLLTRGHSGPSGPTPRPTSGPTPIPSALASLDKAAGGTAVNGLACVQNEPVSNTSFAHLSLYVDGAARGVPAGVGIGSPRQTTGSGIETFVNGACYYPLLTHTADGTLYIEPAMTGATYSLGDFFDLWGQQLSATAVGPASGSVTAFVNGQKFTGDPRSIPLTAHTAVQLDVGAVVPFAQPSFPPAAQTTPQARPTPSPS